MKNEISKTFESLEKEKDTYTLWEKSGYFKPEQVEEFLKKSEYEVKKPFVMTLPPPNANDKLHIGHTCGYSFMDLLARYNRMTGHPTLLIAGKDHASIQTEAVFTRKLEEKGESKWEMGRDAFYKRCYEYCIENANYAREQEKRIGLSADWEREFFTLDPRLTDIIYETFFKMLEEGLIYRGKRIINQCPHCRTALADVDTVHKELSGIFAYIVYPFVDEADKKIAKKKFGVEGITVATTRPETMLGDTAVAVNPDDSRYTEFIGHKVLLPFVEREIPIIADSEIDVETGTGALKVTPAHSSIDFDIAERNKLPIINVIDEEGKMTGEIPSRFIGMETEECSRALVKELDEMGLFVKIERIKHEVAVCERCSTPIQPIISNQWFVNTKPLAEKALEALSNGKTKTVPSGQKNALEHFFKNIQPWCISRQLWWGQPIPIWYSGGKKLYDWLNDNKGKSIGDYEKETGEKVCGSGKIIPGIEKPNGDSNWKGDSKDLILEQETDIFDTWFSSGQWPFSTTMASGVFDMYYPTDVMFHARDILFWWSARMLMLGLYRTGKTPFHTIIVHGMILAEDGSKMSKSKGNGVEPGEMFDKYGVDAVRLWYYLDALPGANSPLREEKIKGNRNFVNKVWNASRFVLINIDDSELENIKRGLNTVGVTERVKAVKSHIENVKRYLNKFQFNLGAENIREFFWHEYCDKWIEEIKNEIKGEKIGSEKRIRCLSELVFLLKENLKIMHPFIPYVTESVWNELVEMGMAEETLMIQQLS